ncbi:FMN-dependent NADH-azoreductase [Methylobacterium crusticola]|uniref:FMN dependent NADH:quinone oxidoreductase n=1 Tax=Methylobacterium crusticola TaxID=1697972 RepID=A0ABQ4R0R7_9HYPH|nr:NAD(P)H-dependent oxidoreductase [Methylobacterium crusticola]GJD51193.1 FMN-dependent NADH-azoreductase [Methylobacterium crusticola]
MTRLLHIDSSASGEASASRRLTGALVRAWRQADPGLAVVARDLGAHPVPHLGEDGVAALRRGETASPAQAEVRRVSDALLDEVEAADVLVIGSPMYNFSLSTPLKGWFDHVLRAGRSFRYTPEGPQGLLGGRRAILVMTRGGLYSEGSGLARNHQEPYLRSLLGFVGITDVTAIVAEGLGLSPEGRDASLARAEAAITDLVARERAGAAA